MRLNRLSIIRKISGIGFQPVELKMTGWKRIPRKDATLICRAMLVGQRPCFLIHTNALPMLSHTFVDWEMCA